MAEIVELRCDQPHRVLLAKMRLSGETPKIGDGNLLELACAQCRKMLRRSDPTIQIVLHRFDFAGEFVETEVRHVAASVGADTSAQRVTGPARVTGGSV